MNLTVRVLTHPMHNSIAEIAKNIAKSNELDDKVLPSLVQETLKSIGLGSFEGSLYRIISLTDSVQRH